MYLVLASRTDQLGPISPHAKIIPTRVGEEQWMFVSPVFSTQFPHVSAHGKIAGETSENAQNSRLSHPQYPSTILLTSRLGACHRFALSSTPRARCPLIGRVPADRQGNVRDKFELLANLFPVF